MKSDYLSIGLKAVKEAETIILKYLNEDIRVQLKEDQSPVTIADKEAEAAIKKCILSAFPDHTFYGEEGEKVDLTSHHGFTWIIDPIDGTKSYLRKNPLFATQLALLKDGEFIIGISNAPLLKELVYAEKGRGCYFNDKPVKVSTVSGLQDAYVSFGSLKYFAKHGNLDSLLDVASDAKWARGIGDFWSYHLLVQGKLEIMIEADTKLWDIAAMKVIVEEAGGRLTQLDGQEINPLTSTALATNSLLHDVVVTKFLESRG
ncbi:MAG TPA: inositol monophosphatase family protein [Candidatus Saccharimonadales bacterium]